MSTFGGNQRATLTDEILSEINIDNVSASSSNTKGSGFSLGQRITSETQGKVDDLKAGVAQAKKSGALKRRDSTGAEDKQDNLFGLARSWMKAQLEETKESASKIKKETKKDLSESVTASLYDERPINPKVISGQLEESSSATDSLMAKPVSTKDFSKQIAGLVKASGDDEFPEAVEMFAEKFDITPNEVYAVINGENKDWKYDGTNKGGYKGLFQIGKGAADFAGIEYKSIANKSPTEQLALYDTYLTAWNYDNSIPLALYQAAPGRASELKNQSDDTVVYPKGSDEWKANKGWRSANNGDITKASLIAYYKR
jgi:hypothetical protein